MTQPRIVHVLSRFGRGGSSRHVLDLCLRLRDRFAATILSGPEEEDEGSLQAEARDAGLDVATIPALHRRGSFLLDRRALQELVEAIRSRRPAIVHTHQIRSGVLGRRAARKAEVTRLVHTYHGLPEKPDRAFVATEAKLARTTEGLIAVGPSLAREISRLGIAPAERLQIVPPVTDPPCPGADAAGEPLRRRLGVPAGAPLVGFVGRLSREKGPDLFLRAFTILLGSLPAARAVVVGGGPDRAALEAEVRRMGLQPRVAFTGWLNDLAPVYEAIDLLVVPSRSEGFSGPALAAMDAGVPVVGSAIGGISDVVAHERGGLLVAAGDVSALAGASILTLRDGDFRSRLSASARAEAASRRGALDASLRHAEIYSGLLGGSPLRPRARSAATAAAVR